MTQADSPTSTGPDPSSARNVDQFCSALPPVPAFQAGTAVVLMGNGLSMIEDRARQLSSLLYLVSQSPAIDDDARDALCAVDTLVCDIRDLARSERLIEVVQ